ncbi:MAG TPA: adenylate/guanylate cyclase domain-containing protein [Pleomorphomonadaceae bacterium]|nr:adenylate/guanylate cyclase domain-containing protein [Pleomorphomonadaceae bacterium]
MTEERRLVTVLFADVTGSTAMGEALDPEDMRALLGRYFAIAQDVVAQHGGTLEKFIGDAVMAVFGLPTAHDDDAARAAASALALRDRVRDDPGLGDRLPIRLGLSTGEVVAAMGGEGGDFLVTGDAVNVAARLQQGAASWEIVCSERTARAAGDGFAFGPVMDLDARGKGAPVRARRLQGAGVSRPRARMPFLGRDADVAQLELTSGRAMRERRPFLITITAPAGTGKTRLLEEFLERLPELHPDARVVTAQCLPYGQRLTYLPLHTLLLQLLGAPDDDDPDAMRQAAEAWLTAGGDPAPRRTAELLAATFGASEGDPIDRAELFAAWRSAVELAATERPLVVVVEDLHWSSDSLLDLIEVILQPRGEAPLMMIVLARPELLDRRPTWGGGRRNYVSLALEPLDDLAISALVDYLLHGPPPEVVQAVVARAEGNPFYAGELARTIQDRAASGDDPADVQAVVSALPDTVHATVLARLDVLPPAARRVLQVGSVFGRSFRLDGVTAVESGLTDGAADAVDHLLEHDLIRTSGRDELTFRHILIREVAYQTMPRAERARLHGAAGAWLERVAAGREEEQAELVAFHFREAVTLGTAAGGSLDAALVDKAVAWLRRAADTAFAGAAYEEASRHLQAAIEIAPRNELPDLWVSLGDIFGGGNRAIEAYAAAARLGRELGRPPDFILRALSGQLMVLGRWGGSVGSPSTSDEIAAIVDEVRALREQATDRMVLAWSMVAESFLPFEAATSARLPTEQDWAQGREVGERAVALARELDDPPLLSAALDGLSAFALGTDPVTGLSLTRERQAMEDRLPLYERSDVHNMVAWFASELGELEDVLVAAEGILRDLAPNQAQATAMSLAAWQTWSLALLGRWDEVTAAAERAGRLWEDSGRLSAGFALHGLIAALEVGVARQDDRLRSRATSVLLGIAEQFPPGHLFRRLTAVVGPDPEALVRTTILDWEPYVTRLHLVERAVAVCADLHHPIPLEGLDKLLGEARTRDQRLLAAQLLRARGIQERAPDNLGEALELFRGFSARPLVARTELELGQLTDDTALVASGTAALEALGDITHLGRVTAIPR